MPHCYVCQETKSLDDFQYDASRSQRVMSKCRACNKATSRGRRRRAKLRRLHDEYLMVMRMQKKG